MRYLPLSLAVLAVIWIAAAEYAQAQVYRVPRSPRAPNSRQIVERANIVPRSRQAPRFRSPGRKSKPFANLQRTPTLSPYLSLTRGDDEGSVLPNYFTFVRPQLEQQRFNQKQQKRIQTLDQQFRQFSAQGAFSPTGSTEIRATGHETRFRNLSHFYNR